MLGSFLIHPCTPDQIEFGRQIYGLEPLNPLYDKPGYPTVFPLNLDPKIGGRLLNEKGETVMIFPIIPLTPVQFLQRRANQAEQAVRRAISLSLNEGAEVIGLGALTSPVTDGGRRLVGWEGLKGALLTTGNSYTSYAAFKSICNVATTIDKEIDSRDFEVAIIGATGSVGQGLASLLLQKGMVPRNITGIGRNDEKIAKLKANGINAGTMDLVNALSRADVVVFCTSGYPHLSYNAILGASAVIDMTMPSFVEANSDLKTSLLNNGIIFEHGGIISFKNGFRYEGVPLGLDPMSTTGWACEIETALRALDNERGRHAIGPVEAAEAERMARRASHYGFQIVLS